MPLSPEEQRKLDEIEQALRDDEPALGSRVGVPAPPRRGSGGGVARLFGAAALLAGTVAAQALLAAWVGVAFNPAGWLLGAGGMLALGGRLFVLRRSPKPPQT